jgi:hypothetical protein
MIQTFTQSAFDDIDPALLPGVIENQNILAFNRLGRGGGGGGGGPTIGFVNAQGGLQFQPLGQVPGPASR